MKTRLTVGLAIVAIGTIVTVVACNWRLHTRTPPVLRTQKAPGFSLPDAASNTVTLDTLTATGPAVVVFYRGYW